MKKLLLLVVLLVAILFIGVWFAGDVLKKGVEEGGTWALGSETSLSSASVSLMAGRVALDEFRVASPKGFQAEKAMSVDRIDVQAEVGSFLSDTIVIDHIDIDSPEITLEISTGGSNLGALMDHLKSRTGGGGTADPPEQAPGGPSKKLRIGRVTISSAKVILAQSLLMKTELEIPLPTLEITELGGGEGGGDSVTLPELLERIVGTILAAVARAEGLPGDLKAILDNEVIAKVQEQLENLRDQAGQAVEKLGKAKEKLTDKVGEGLEDLKGGLGGLFGGDGKDQ